MECALIAGFTRRTSFTLAKYLLSVKKYRLIISDSVDKAEKRKMIAELSELGAVEACLGAQNPEILKKYNPSVVFVSPGVPPTIPLLQEAAALGIPLTNDIDYFASEFPRRVIAAITGTDGKTSASTWLHHILSRKIPCVLGGNVGTPVFAYADARYEDFVHVLELSSFQLEYARHFHAKAATVLNIAPDHLDRYPDVDAYASAKKGIFRNMGASGLALLNADDAYTPFYRKGLNAQVQFFSYTDRSADWYAPEGRILFRGKPFYDCAGLRVLGRHQHQNAMAVSALASFLGLSQGDISEGLDSFEGVEHRLQYLGEKNGVRFYNDSKATSPQALGVALSAFPQKIILLAGGRSKGVPFDSLLPLIQEKTKAVFPFGDLSDELKKAWRLPAGDPYNLEQAFLAAADYARPGDIIVLSPGGTSYDAFSDYEERGRFFAALFRGAP